MSKALSDDDSCRSHEGGGPPTTLLGPPWVQAQTAVTPGAWCSVHSLRAAFLQLARQALCPSAPLATATCDGASGLNAADEPGAALAQGTQGRAPEARCSARR